MIFVFELLNLLKFPILFLAITVLSILTGDRRLSNSRKMGDDLPLFVPVRHFFWHVLTNLAFLVDLIISSLKNENFLYFPTGPYKYQKAPKNRKAHQKTGKHMEIPKSNTYMVYNKIVGDSGSSSSFRRTSWSLLTAKQKLLHLGHSERKSTNRKER